MAIDVNNSPTLSAEIQEILSENSHLKYLSENGKIKCSLSGHEMSCDAKVVNSYLHGKKHKRLKALNDYDYDKYRQHLVDSTKRFPKNQLLCLLTYKYINNLQSSLQKHINGRKFQKAFKKWEELKKEGKEYIVPKKQPNSSENFEDIGKKRKKKSKYEEDGEDESDNDSLSDLYPREEFPKKGKKHVVSKKQKPNCSENFEDIGKKRKKKRKYEEDEEDKSDNDSLSDLYPREEFQKESKEYVVSKKQKANSSENCKDIGKKRKKKSKYEKDEEEESDNDGLSDLYPTEEFQKNDVGHKSVKKKKYASESKFKKKKKKRKKVAVTV